jgi:outer membrane scaffolding protein for murein synthesis (MipA/OmpV family)
MKNLFLILFSLCILNNSSYAQSVEEEKPLIEEFHIDPVFSLGVGVSLMTDHPKPPYASAKVFLARYGEDYAGMRFLGAGVAVDDKRTNLVFSPAGIHLKRFILSIDIMQGPNEGAGVSLNYSF